MSLLSAARRCDVLQSFITVPCDSDTGRTVLAIGRICASYEPYTAPKPPPVGKHMEVIFVEELMDLYPNAKIALNCRRNVYAW